MAGPVVELTGVVAGYGGRPVLQGATCRVFPGELVVITGPNGAGKTTLLRVILGLLPPISGEVRLFQQSLRSGAVRRALRRRVGYVAQERPPGALPMTVSDAVLLGRWGRTFGGWRRPGRQDREAVARWIGRVGLGGLEDRDLRELSGGQRQRVALARALVGEPDLLVLDEPTTHLDGEARESLLDLIVRLHGGGELTTLLVSHDPGVVARYGDRHFVVASGRLEEQRPAGFAGGGGPAAAAPCGRGHPV